MKTMTCNQLGGACNEKFTAETFQEISEMSQAHAKEMIEKQDPSHVDAMRHMQIIMRKDGGMETWLRGKEFLFNALPKNRD